MYNLASGLWPVRWLISYNAQQSALVQQAAGGVLFALIVFATAFVLRREVPARGIWLAVSVNAIVGGTLIGWSVANVPLEFLGPSGWLQSLAFVGVALLAPPVLSAARLRSLPLPRFSRLLGPAAERIRDPLAWLAGALLIAVALLAILSALGLVLIRVIGIFRSRRSPRRSCLFSCTA